MELGALTDLFQSDYVRGLATGILLALGAAALALWLGGGADS